jgi:hypothetical protein
MLQFHEPHPTGGDCVVKISEEKAIEYQKSIRNYESDEDALDDFIAIHFAYYVKEERTPSFKMKIETRINDKEISQQIKGYNPLIDDFEKVTNMIYNTQDEHIRKALEKLGWKPPKKS